MAPALKSVVIDDDSDDDIEHPTTMPTPTGLVRWGLADPSKRHLRIVPKPGTPAAARLSAYWHASPFPIGCGPHDWMRGEPDLGHCSDWVIV
jgi:hypothetical protein